MAVSSFVVSGVIVAGAGYLYVNKDNIVESIKDRAAAEIAEVLPGMIGGAMGGMDLAPELPVTQPSLPF